MVTRHEAGEAGEAGGAEGAKPSPGRTGPGSSPGRAGLGSSPGQNRVAQSGQACDRVQALDQVEMVVGDIVKRHGRGEVLGRGWRVCECGVEISSAISQLSGTFFTWLLAPRLGFTDGETLGCLLPHVLVFLTGRPSVPASSGGAHAAGRRRLWTVWELDGVQNSRAAHQGSRALAG